VERERGADGWLCLYEDGGGLEREGEGLLLSHDLEVIIKPAPVISAWIISGDTKLLTAAGWVCSDGRSRRYEVLMYVGVFRAAISHRGTRGVVIAPRLV
jgi:hypothetical protein